MARPTKQVTRENHARCINCFEEKRLNDFPRHKAMSNGRRPNCKVCHGVYQYQRTLGLMLKDGDKSVVECSVCERYMKKCSYKACITCRRENKWPVEVTKIEQAEYNQIS